MLRPWKLSLDELPDPGQQSLRMHIVHSMIRDIQRGRLAPGAFLPSSRELAVSVGVNRKTIVLVYEELKAQGWIEATSTRGTRRSEEHTSELQSLMRISYAGFCLKKKKQITT